jgi:hypothetical protein
MPDSSGRFYKYFEDDVKGVEPRKTVEDLPEGDSKAGLLSRLVNATSMGTGGAQIGAMIGGPAGATIGGIAGAGAGMLMPPSDTPMTDAGALAGELLMSRVIPGGGATRRLAKLVGLPVATAMGAGIGSMGDKAADFIQDTPYGKIAFYGGAAALSQGMNVWAQSRMQPSAALKAADEVAAFTKDNPIPLSLAEGTGNFEGLSRSMLAGTQAEKALGEAQNQAAIKAFQKIANGEIERMLPLAEEGVQAGRTGVKNVRDSYTKRVSVPDPATGKTVTREVTDWKKLAADYGLDADETKAFQHTLRTAPEVFIESLFPANGKDNLRGLAAIRALSKTVGVDEPELFGKLGTAAVMRVLSKNRAFQPDPSTGEIMLSGPAFSKALMRDFGTERLELMLGSERAEALRALSVVMSEADPARKIASNNPSQQQRVLSYMANKMAFSLMSISAGATAGSQVGGGNLMSTLAGGAMGAMAVIPLSTLMSKIIASPEAARTLIAASKGNGTASTQLVRALTTGAMNGEEKRPERQYSSPRSRLQGFLAQ